MIKYRINNSQAQELIDFLILNLKNEGFRSIVDEVTAILAGREEERKFENSINYLIAFLEVSIDIFDSLSNKNYPDLISKLNNSILGENKISTISVEYFNQGETALYNLETLPDYKEIITLLEGILRKINAEN